MKKMKKDFTGRTSAVFQKSRLNCVRFQFDKSKILFF